MKRKKIWKWVKIIVVIYLVVGLAIYFFQDKIFFHPVKLNPEDNYGFNQPYKEVNIPVNESSNINIVQFQSTDTFTKGVVLYFHGNKTNVSRYAKFAPNFTKHGYEVWMIDYPGFGKSTGEFSERVLYTWAMEMYKLASARFSADSIIIYGKSFGTCIAAQLAFKKDCKQLILETPYYDFASVIRHYGFMYPVASMLHYKMATWQYLQHVKAPITIFHGTGDGIISYSNSERLKPFLKPGDEFITIKGGSHNDLYKFNETVQKLDSLLTLPK